MEIIKNVGVTPLAIESGGLAYFWGCHLFFYFFIYLFFFFILFFSLNNCNIVSNHIKFYFGTIVSYNQLTV